jgi:hypothetical protein
MFYPSKKRIVNRKLVHLFAIVDSRNLALRKGSFKPAWGVSLLQNATKVCSGQSKRRHPAHHC